MSLAQRQQTAPAQLAAIAAQSFANETVYLLGQNFVLRAREKEGWLYLRTGYTDTTGAFRLNNDILAHALRHDISCAGAWVSNDHFHAANLLERLRALTGYERFPRAKSALTKKPA